MLGRDDVFNSPQINKTQIEAEILASTKIYFTVKFSTTQKDVSIEINDGKNEAEISSAKLHFKTGILSDAKSSSQKLKQMNDLQTKVMPKEVKEYLKNEQVRESLNDLERVHSEILNYYFDKEKANGLTEYLKGEFILPIAGKVQKRSGHDLK